LSRGKFGEKLAESYLKQKGYKIIFKNFLTKYAEIDIIAEHGSNLVFAEVKYRTNKFFGRAEESISPNKLKKIEKAAEFFVSNFYKGSKKNFRIDIVAINNFNKLEINHYINVTGG
jgi:putative endonuclease